MRQLLPMLAVAYAAGLVFADRLFEASTRSRSPAGALLDGPLLDTALWPALGLWGAALVAFGLAWSRVAARTVAAVAVMAAAGGLSLGQRLEAAERHSVERVFDATVWGRVCAQRVSSGWIDTTLCHVSGGRDLAEPLPTRLILGEPPETPAGERLAALRLGDWVRARLRVRPLDGLRNPGGRDRRDLRRRGIGGRASLVDASLCVRVLEPGAEQARGSWIEAWRRRIGDVLSDHGSGGALLRALVVGDRSGLTTEQRSTFRRLGIGHLLAVSGLHLALVAAFAFATARWLLVRLPPIAERMDIRLPGAGLAVLAAASYAVLSGWGAPVQRALVFVSIAVAALCWSRRRSAPHLLSAAALLVLLREPASLFDLGVQLSFAASAGLLSALAPAAGGAERRWRIFEGLMGGLRATATAVAVTAPIIAWHAGSVGPAALIANSVAVPWVGFVLLPAALGAAGIALLPGAGENVLLAGAAGLGRISLDAIALAAPWAPELRPGATPAAWVLAVATLLALAVLRSRGTGRRFVLARLVVFVLRWGPVAGIEPRVPRLVAFDVGQGDAVLVEGRAGAMLVDAGGAWAGGGDLGRSVVVPGLAALGVRRLDLVVASHADLDHSGGLASVLGALDVGEVWLPPGGRADPGFAAVLARGAARGVRIRERRAGDASVRFGDLRVTPLWPPAGWTAPSRNDGSLVVRVEVAGRRLLLAGDLSVLAEERLLAAAADLRADVLKVAHHGSRTSSSPELLSEVDASAALISAACSVRRHLPHRESIERLRAVGSAVWWTGRDGALLVSLGDPMTVWGFGRGRGGEACGARASGVTPGATPDESSPLEEEFRPPRP